MGKDSLDKLKRTYKCLYLNRIDKAEASRQADIELADFEVDNDFHCGYCQFYESGLNEEPCSSCRYCSQFFPSDEWIENHPEIGI